MTQLIWGDRVRRSKRL